MSLLVNLVLIKGESPLKKMPQLWWSVVPKQETIVQHFLMIDWLNESFQDWSLTLMKHLHTCFSSNWKTLISQYFQLNFYLWSQMRYTSQIWLQNSNWFHFFSLQAFFQSMVTTLLTYLTLTSNNTKPTNTNQKTHTDQFISEKNCSLPYLTCEAKL